MDDDLAYAIYHFDASGHPSIGLNIRDNFFENNSLGNFSPDILTLTTVTIDNPETESLFIRRGSLISP